VNFSLIKPRSIGRAAGSSGSREITRRASSVVGSMIGLGNQAGKQIIKSAQSSSRHRNSPLRVGTMQFASQPAHETIHFSPNIDGNDEENLRK
jgi:hypothetical protein